MGNTYNSESALEVYLSWPPANYINPVRRTWLPAFAVAWQALSTLLLAGRFYLRARRQAGSFGLDDAMIFFGWLFSIGLTTGAYLGSDRYGLDRHTWDLQPTMYAGLALVSAFLHLPLLLADFPRRPAGSTNSCSPPALFRRSSLYCSSTVA